MLMMLATIAYADCGDSVLETADGETCDDGNTDPLDGCSATCTVEAGWECAQADFTLDFTEQMTGTPEADW